MAKKVTFVIISIFIGYCIGYGLRNELAIVNGFIASMLVFIYMGMNNKDSH